MKLPFAPTPRIPIAPPCYFAPRAKGPLTLNGRLDKPFWKDVPWTEEFVDISGPDFPAPRFPTRAKVCWDDENLYIGAALPGPEMAAAAGGPQGLGAHRADRYPLPGVLGLPLFH